jgi:hypothetical protein
VRRSTGGKLVATIALVAASVVVFGTAPAGATDVSNESELRAAYGDTSESLVTLTADIDLTCEGGGELTRNSATALTLDGGGHTITQTCDQNRVVSQSGSGALTFEDVTLTGGQALGNGGGGIWVTGGGDLTLMRTSVVGNEAPTTGGGGINAESATLVDSFVAGNIAADFGGAMNVVSATLINSTVAGNESTGRAGGIAAADVTVINSTVSQNQAGRGPGGALYAFEVTLVYATVADNESPGQSNIYAETSITSFGSVVAGALGGGSSCGGGASTTTNGYNYSDDDTCGFSGSTDQQSAADPLLGEVADNGGPTETQLPAAASPLLDGIPGSACRNDGAADITTDQRGVTRPQGDGCDIGAVEVEVTAPSSSTTPSTPATAGTVQPRFTG